MKFRNPILDTVTVFLLILPYFTPSRKFLFKQKETLSVCEKRLSPEEKYENSNKNLLPLFFYTSGRNTADNVFWAEAEYDQDRDDRDRDC